MKVTFISNFFNHHQKPFSEAMYKLTNGDYRFVATEKMTEERRKMGWGETEIPNYVIEINNKIEEQYCLKLSLDSDIVIIGSAPDLYFIQRLKEKKLTFRYSERFYKEGINYKNILCLMASAWKHHWRYQRYPFYLLCASAYTAADAALFGNYISRTYKWGYFPETKYYDIDSLIKQKQKNTILWAGRFLEWKHPKISIYIAERLKKDGYNFRINLIGCGDMEDELRFLIKEKKLYDCVNLLGSMPPTAVRKYMENSSIFLFTSDFREGWGAVLNESMNSGCAVVASHAIGSVPFLINNGVNGLIYENGNIDQAYKYVKYLLDNPSQAELLGKNAYQTIIDTWNAEKAASNFIQLCEALLKGKDTPIESGPCSKAEIIKNDWINRV